MLIAARNGFMVGKRLPYDAEVEYLLSTSNADGSSGQNIDTGVIVGDKSHVQVVMSDNTSVGRWIFGARQGYLNRVYGIYSEFENNYFKWAFGNSLASPFVYATDSSSVGRVTIDINGSNLTITREKTPLTHTATISGSPFTTPVPLSLFCLNNNGVVTSYSSLRIYGCKVWDNGALVRDYQPVRFTNDFGVSEGAMYDRANPTVGMNADGTARNDGLYFNRGTGAFVIGPDKVPPQGGV